MPLVGERVRPYRRPPPRFGIEGLPYGAFCRCGSCGHEARSTAAFDFYADGEQLVCEHCLYGLPYKTGQQITREIDNRTLRRDPLGPGCRGGYDDCLG